MNRPPEVAPAADAGAINDGSVSSKIDEFGPHVGTLLSVEDWLAGTGTRGYAIRFKSKGRFSPVLKLFAYKNDGSHLPGFGIIQAMMFLCDIKEALQPVEGLVKRWDEAQGKTVEMSGWVYPQFQGKRIGLYLKHQVYDNKRTGRAERQLAIQCPFHPVSGQTVNEFKKGAQATAVQNIWDKEMDNPVPSEAELNRAQGTQSDGAPPTIYNTYGGQGDNEQQQPVTQEQQPAQVAQQAQPAAEEDFNDDIPF